MIPRAVLERENGVSRRERPQHWGQLRIPARSLQKMMVHTDRQTADNYQFGVASGHEKGGAQRWS